MKKFLSVFISIILIISSFVVSAYAQDESIYEETRSEIDLSCLNVSVVDGKKLKYNSRSGFFKKIVGNREKEKLDDLLASIPEYENLLIDYMNCNEPIHTLSVVNVPVVWAEDHYERIKKENHFSLSKIFSKLFISASATSFVPGEWGDVSERGVFTIGMGILKRYNEETDENEYVTITLAFWTGHSIVGGANYPAMGEDIIAVSSPYYSTMIDNKLEAQYVNYKDDIREGSETATNPDFWLKEVEENYCAYAIKEDPLWTWQLQHCIVTTTFVGDYANKTRKATSKYVHTWKSMDFDIEVLLGNSQEETKIVIVPDIVEKTWECACYVSFDF